MSDPYREAKRCRRRGDYARAGDLFDLAGYPEEALEMYKAGRKYTLAARLLQRQGRHKEAAKLYAKSGKHKMAATLFQSAGDIQEAARQFLLAGDSYQAALCQERLGLLSEAAKNFERSGHFEQAAKLFIKDQQFGRAASLCEGLYRGKLRLHATSKVSGVAVGDADYRRRFGKLAGDLYYKSKRFDKAAGLLSETGEHFGAARAFEKTGQFLEAADHYLRARRTADAERMFTQLSEAALGPKDLIRLRRLRAEVLFLRDRHDEAGALFYELGEYRRAAESFERAGDLGRAAECHELAGDYGRAGSAYAQIGNFAAAARAIEACSDYALAADYYMRAGQSAKAADMYARSNQYMKAARIWIASGAADQSIRVLQHIDASDPDYGEACLLLGHLFRNKGMPEAAIEKYREAAGLVAEDTPESLDLYYGLAQAYEKADQPEAALETYARVLARDYQFRDAAKRHAALRKHLRQRAATTAKKAAQAPSQTQQERYELIRQLGAGLQGTVYLARDVLLGREVALKVLNERLMRENVKVDRFMAAARNASRLNHSNIVTIFDTGTFGGSRFIAMEYIKGPSLRDLLNAGTSIPITTLLDTASGLLEGLGHAHRRGVIHGNLRPENVLIDGSGQVKITDFGLTERLSDVRQLPEAHKVLRYVSPEQISGIRLRPPSDLYSFGVILYELVTGSPPFPDDNIEQRHLRQPAPALDSGRLRVPRVLCDIIERCLAKRPEDRFPTTADALAALRPTSLGEGSFIGGRYEIKKLVGQGGMGKVYLAVDTELDEEIAMKVIRPSVAEDEEAVTRFKREIKLTRMIQHENVVKIYDMGEADGHRFITMEYIDGVSLKDLLIERGPMDIVMGARVFLQVLSALAAAHRIGIVHRDIKPQNILIDSKGKVRIVDFGIATVQNLKAITTTGVVIGTPEYMSPEQIEGRTLTGQSDVYSLGVTMYEVFTGRLPFEADTAMAVAMKHLQERPVPASNIRPEIPPALDVIILRALAKDLAKRFLTAEEMARSLEPLCQVSRSKGP